MPQTIESIGGDEVDRTPDRLRTRSENVEFILLDYLRKKILSFFVCLLLSLLLIRIIYGTKAFGTGRSPELPNVTMPTPDVV